MRRRSPTSPPCGPSWSATPSRSPPPRPSTTPTAPPPPAGTVNAPDSLTLANATVKITGGTFAGDGDVLAASTSGTSISASYNAATETLTLTGSDTLAHYTQVLDSVTFKSGPNPGN